IAASLERDSEHVLSKAIVRHAREKNLTLFESRDVRAVPGLGVTGSVLVDGSWIGVLVGTGELMEREGLEMGDAPPLTESTDATRVYVAWGGSVRGSLELTDTLRQNAREVIGELKGMNIQTWMLSGDSEGVTRRIGDALGIAEAFGRLLPADKLETIRRLRSSGGLMMVGDGINDAPSLAAADVGVTLGSATDIAKESADVTIIGDHLEKIPWLIQFSRRVLSTIRWNLVWAFGYNAVGMAFAIAGLLEPILAAVAMVLSSLFIIVNSRRLIRD
ncbi:MAG: HAD-IC family P-type ATPase, partial [Bacteroidota bacterium]